MKKSSKRTLAKDIVDFVSGRMESKNHALKKELEKLDEITEQYKELIEKNNKKEDE